MSETTNTLAPITVACCPETCTLAAEARVGGPIVDMLILKLGEEVAKLILRFLKDRAKTPVMAMEAGSPAAAAWGVDMLKAFLLANLLNYKEKAIDVAEQAIRDAIEKLIDLLS